MFLADRLCSQGHCSQHCFCLHFSQVTSVLSLVQTAPVENKANHVNAADGNSFKIYKTTLFLPTL